MRYLIAIWSIFLCSSLSQAQHGMAFYHLRNATFQSTSYNAAYMPAGKVFVGLPVLSGVNFYANSPVSYNNLVITNESGQRELNFTNAINKLNPVSLIALNADISLFHAGVRLPNGLALALFVNERIDFNVSIPRSFPRLFWNGNGSFVGRRLDFELLGITGNHFREYGLAAAIENEDKRLKLGVRAKYLQGIVNISTPASLDIDVLTLNQNYQLQLEVQNAIVRTAGVEVLRGNEGSLPAYLISNGNRGFALDMGMEKRMNRYASIALSVSDLGFINWNEGIKNYQLNDTSMLYTGADLNIRQNILNPVEDSLFSKFNINNNTDSYFAMLPTRVLGSYIYKLPGGPEMITSVGGRLIQGYPRMMYGFGLRQYFSPNFILSGSVTKVPQQFLNVGAAFSATAGFAQLYASVDKVMGYNVPNTKWVEFRVGLNLVFGARKPPAKSSGPSGSAYKELKPSTREPGGVVTPSFMGSTVKVKKQEGLYTIIPKQEQSEARTVTPDVVNNAREQRKVQSETGSVQTNNKREKQSIRTESGKVLKNNRNPNQVRSSSGSAQKPPKIKKRVKSKGGSSGTIQQQSYKKTATRSISGQQRNQSANKRRKKG